MYFRATILVCISAWALSSCAKLGLVKQTTKPEPSPFGTTGIPPQLRPKSAAAPTVLTPQSIDPAKFTAEEDIVFTDPDNPDAGIPELSQVLASQEKKKGPWEESETLALRRASREGKPVLIWFTDSLKSPMCKALSQELFSRPDFGEWADKNIVRLKVDDNVSANSYVSDKDIGLDVKETRRIDAANYVERMKKRYKALGHPFLVMLQPSGEVMQKFRGYKRGEAEFLFGQLKHQQIVSAQARDAWRAKMAGKGYREWRDNQGRSVFAKLTGYKDGTLTLIEPDGTRSRTTENKLSADDRKWIDEQKKARGM